MNEKAMRVIEERIEEKLDYVAKHPADEEYNAELIRDVLELRRGIIILKLFNARDLVKEF